MAIDPLDHLLGVLARPPEAQPRRPVGRGPVGAPSRQPRGGSRTARLRPIQAPSVSQETGGGGLFSDLTGYAGKALMKTLDVVDTPRAFIAAGLKDILDENSSVDLGQIWDDAMRNIRFNEAVGLDDADMPGWLKGTIGFAGDLATDPLMYSGVGIATQSAKGVAGQGVKTGIASAAKHGSRKELAQAVARASVDANLDDLGEAGARVVARLTENAASQGRAAFTTRGLRQIGVDEKTVQEVVERIGADLDFRYGLRFGSKVVGGQKLTRPIAEGVTNVKGALTSRVFGNRVASSLRPWFAARQSNYNHLLNDLLSGAADDPVKTALDLSRIEAARGFSRKFVDQAVRQADAEFGKKLRRMDRQQRNALVDELESALMDPNAKPVTEMGVKVRKMFDDLFADVRRMNPSFEYRRGYVPHYLTPEGKTWAAANPEMYKTIVGLTDTPAGFQRARQIVAGRKIGNTTLQTGSIREINEVAAKELGISQLLNDDPAYLLMHYIEQAGDAVYGSALDDMAIRFGMGSERPLVPRKAALAEEDPIGAKLLEDAALGGRRAAVEAGNTAGAATQEAVGRRTAGLQAVSQEMADEVDVSASIIGAAEREADDLASRVTAGQAEVAAAQVAEANAEESVKAAGRAATAARRAHSRKWKRVIKDNQEYIDAIKAQYPDEWQDSIRVKGAQQAIDEAQAALERGPWEEVALEQAKRDHERARNLFFEAEDKLADVRNRLAWANADLPTLKAQHAKVVRMYETAQFPRPKGASPQAWRDYNDLLRDRASTISQMLNDPDFDGVLFVDKFRRLEAQAAEFDMLALKQRREAFRHTEAAKAFEDRLFVEKMVRDLDEGYYAYNQTYQLPQDVRDRLQYEVKSIQERLANSSDIIKVVGETYDKILALWKQYAVATPGFVSRNLYGGLFNMFVLDGVDPRSVLDFNAVYHIYRKGGKDWVDEAARTLVSRKHPGSRAWRQEARAAGMDPVEFAKQQIVKADGTAGPILDSFHAAAATGFGQVPAELSGIPRIEGGNWNPLSQGFKPTRKIRDWSEHVEAVMRGSHAFDVIRKGGTRENAIARVQKFHFNYQDIGQFDQVAKKIIPFWTFWSRNLPLQAQMWMRSPQKINQSLVNATANIEALSEPDANKPDYFNNLGMTRLPIETGDGGHMYGAMDFPTMRLPDDLNRITNLGENPIGPLADAAPWFKLPLELAFNKNSFYDTEFKNEPFERDREEGGFRVRSAPVPLDLPGVRNVAALLPGLEMIDGELAITDKAEHVLDQVPVMRYQNILFPEKRDEASATARRVSALFGVQWRPNSREMQERKAFYDRLDEAEKARYDAIIRSLGGQ